MPSAGSLEHPPRASARCPSGSRHAVVDSQRLVMVLDSLARQGLRRRGATDLLSPSEVQEPIQAVRAAVGRLASTTPSKLSSDYDEYNRRVEALIAAGRSVLGRGLAPVALEELDEWGPFREP